jgi:hypothetical protein
VPLLADMLISLMFIADLKNIDSNEINALTAESDRLLDSRQGLDRTLAPVVPDCSHDWLLAACRTERHAIACNSNATLIAAQ